MEWVTPIPQNVKLPLYLSRGDPERALARKYSPSVKMMHGWGEGDIQHFI